MHVIIYHMILIKPPNHALLAPDPIIDTDTTTKQMHRSSWSAAQHGDPSAKCNNRKMNQMPFAPRPGRGVDSGVVEWLGVR